MPITFIDSPNLKFDYHPIIPRKTIKLRLHTKNNNPSISEPSYKLNLTALRFYGLYKNSVYASYKNKTEIAQDINNYKKVYVEESSKLSKELCYQDPIYHYSVAASIGAMQEWQDKHKTMRCFIASEYSSHAHRYTPIGFVHFEEAQVNNKRVVYIAQMGVTKQGKGIGRRLMECVLTHYPSGTEFYVLTRVFNTEAKILYQNKFGFQPIQEEEIRQLGYDARYCGFKHTTLLNEIENINKKMIRPVEKPVNNLEKPKFSR